MDSTGREFIVAVIHDITERQKMQSALKESEAWYRILFEHTGAATIIISENGTIEQANTEFTRLTGFAPNEIEGIMSLKHIACKEDIPMIKHYHHDRRIAPSSVPSSYTVRIVDRLGEMKILHAVVALIPGTKKSIASYVDISEQKRSEDAIKQMNRKLNLLSSITRHDIINQILILKGFLSLLKQSTGDASLLKYITKSEQAIHNIEHQIIFTRDYQDMGVKNPVWQNLRNTIITAKGAFNFEKISFETRVQDIEIFADPLFEKVFHNLIDNSIKYGGTDMKSIRISSHETDTGIEILYEYDGVGIETSEREKLFERGFGKHTGFGLFLSRDILSITGITIDEMGTQGTGVRFLIQVPKGGYRIAR
jgi:PAS domain S-box-containing protein